MAAAPVTGVPDGTPRGHLPDHRGDDHLGDVDVRRSRRRTRTVSAYRDGDRTVVLIPARFSPAEEQEWVDRMVTRLEAADRRRNPLDGDLLERSRELSRRHLDGLARPQSVAWVDNQHHRWGSCTPADGSIRLSSRLQGMPSWVLDYVILHELAHLLVPTHSRQFWGLLESYPKTERARGFLAGFDHATGREGPGHHDRDDEDELPEDEAPEHTPAEAGPPGTPAVEVIATTG
ncbi:M48 family metallopeptidase [Kineococcus rhizosphaerae]|uniref:M48 metallopeptidase family protein n=1 Tax=Kineococcus rhizosphaerae TaxID=559628 RepID=UPI001FEC9FCE|nr:M48 family metallopeptidase [Kineococcus rhizosphaerae]